MASHAAAREWGEGMTIKLSTARAIKRRLLMQSLGANMKNRKGWSLMRQFEIEICRMPTQHCVLRLDASTQKEAEHKANEIAGDQDYQTSDVSYRIEYVTELVVGPNEETRRQLVSGREADGAHVSPVARNELRAALHTVLTMAEDQLADIESGISEGLYDLKCNVDLPQKQSAIKLVGEQLRVMAAPVPTDRYSQSALREAIELMAVAANMDDVCMLTPYALQRLEVFGKLFCRRIPATTPDR